MVHQEFSRCMAENCNVLKNLFILYPILSKMILSQWRKTPALRLASES